MENINILNHLAIIVDGNGRWATSRGKSRSKGHDAGLKNLKKISEYILNKEINYLSLFVFSTENFKRDNEEVNYLMKLFTKTFKKEKNFFLDKNIRVIFSGRKENLPKDVVSAIKETEQITKNCTSGVCNFCLNYGGQSEIVDAVNKIIKDKKNNVTVEEFNKYLYQDLPPIDLMIRTSGELRISNFMLWQLAYAELYFTDTYFPDLTTDEIDEILINYSKRNRRFGKNS